jgi:hypothetical protein
MVFPAKAVIAPNFGPDFDSVSPRDGLQIRKG